MVRYLRIFLPPAKAGYTMLVIAVCSAFVAAMSGTSRAAVLCVNQHNSHCASTIAAAISVASAGDTIEVSPGTYQEEVTITLPLTLIGKGKFGKATVIDATGLDHAILVANVTSGPVVIERITAANANREGILVENSTGVTITDDSVLDNDKALSGTTCAGSFPFDQEDCGEGLHLLSSADSMVSNNLVAGNAGGILLTDELGPNHDNVITGNVVQDNTPDCGITLPSHPPCASGSSDSVGCIGGPEIGQPSGGVYDNVVSNNVSQRNGAAGTGIFTPTPGTAAYNNLVSGNLLRDNGAGGVVLHSHAVAQNLNGNTIVGNVISGNGGDPDSEGAGSPPPVGIVIFSDASAQPAAAPITGTTISQNTISNENVDVLVGTTATNLSLHQNDLFGDSSVLGVENTGTGSVDAAQNYWGCASGPGTPNCSTASGTVVSAPFLTAP
jgi:parallel beta-helix repeat protein